MKSIDQRIERLKTQILEGLEQKGILNELQSRFLCSVSEFIQTTEFDVFKPHRDPRRTPEYETAEIIVAQFLLRKKMKNSLKSTQNELKKSISVDKNVAQKLNLDENEIWVHQIVDEWKKNKDTLIQKNKISYRKKLEERLKNIEEQRKKPKIEIIEQKDQIKAETESKPKSKEIENINNNNSNSIDDQSHKPPQNIPNTTNKPQLSDAVPPANKKDKKTSSASNALLSTSSYEEEEEEEDDFDVTSSSSAQNKKKKQILTKKNKAAKANESSKTYSEYTPSYSAVEKTSEDSFDVSTPKNDVSDLDADKLLQKKSISDTEVTGAKKKSQGSSSDSAKSTPGGSHKSKGRKENKEKDKSNSITDLNQQPPEDEESASLSKEEKKVGIDRNGAVVVENDSTPKGNQTNSGFLTDEEEPASLFGQKTKGPKSHLKEVNDYYSDHSHSKEDDNYYSENASDESPRRPSGNNSPVPKKAEKESDKNIKSDVPKNADVTPKNEVKVSDKEDQKKKSESDLSSSKIKETSEEFEKSEAEIENSEEEIENSDEEFEKSDEELEKSEEEFENSGDEQKPKKKAIIKNDDDFNDDDFGDLDIPKTKQVHHTPQNREVKPNEKKGVHASSGSEIDIDFMDDSIPKSQIVKKELSSSSIDLSSTGSFEDVGDEPPKLGSKQSKKQNVPIKKAATKPKQPNNSSDEFDDNFDV